MNTRGQSNRIPDFKLQAAKSVADTISYYTNRFVLRQAFQKIIQYISNDDASFLHIQEPLDETTNFGVEKNPSFINESKSERGYSRQLLLSNQVSLIPQKSARKMLEKNFEDDKNLTAGLNRSTTKPGNYLNEKEGVNDKVLELNQSEPKWPAQNNYEDDKKFKLDLFSVQTKAYASSALRIGDIVYFKHVIEVQKKDGKPHKMTGILSGDGVASNRLELINRNLNPNKNANFLFRKTLFRVEPSRKYYYQKLYKKMVDSEEVIDGVHLAEHENKLNFLKRKYQEEKDENDSEFRNVLGQPVLYGQTIHLKHMYSNCYLTFQPHSLAWQYGCIELTLEEEGSENSNFKFLASGNLKTKEDVVAFSDHIDIMSSRGDYHMHVWDEQNTRNTLENGLEVNGSESSSNWKILRFMDCEEYREFESNNSFLESGDIVRIIHKISGDTLSVPPKSLDPMISIRNIILNNELEENYGPQRSNIPTKIIDPKIPAPAISLTAARKYTISDVWEIQRRNSFIGGFARWDETFRVKNISTGLFLYQDPISERLKLIPDGSKEECYFQLVPKKMDDKRHRIEYGELIRIQTVNRSYLQQPMGKKDSSDLCGPKVTDSTKMYFYLEYLSNDMTETANRLASLFPCLLNFYCFLQNWGVLMQSSMLQKEDIAIYDYTKAIESERDLDLETEDLSEALENLESFLKETDAIPFKVKQNLLLEQKIIDIFLLIVELINTKIHGSRATKEEKEEEEKYKLEGARTEEEWDLLEKTPQFLARKYLDKHVKRIYNILYLCTKGNLGVSSAILKNSTFLSRQLVYYRKESGTLLKEAITNSAQLGDSDPHGEQIVKWVSFLEMIRESEGNLQLQILYLEIISLACLDTRRRGIPKYQNKVLQEFFSPNSHFLKGLVTFIRRNGKVYVSFAKKPEVSKEEFMESNFSLTPANEIKYEEFEGKYFFSLQELSLSRTPGVEQIIDYLSSVLWLFYSLCKNRNQDGINHIKGIGLQSDVLMSCMHEDYIHIKLKRGFIVLYEVLFIDVEPYKSIKDCSNHCYIWEEIEQKKLSDYTFMWHSLSNYNKVDWLKDYDKEKVKLINDFILNFWDSGKNIKKLPMFGVQKNYFASNDQEYLEKAGLIHAMLKFTKNAINLGFTNSSVNNQVLYSIVNLFEVFNKKKGKENKKQETNENEFWVAAFVKSNGLSTRHEIFNQIYLEALEIFQVMADLRLSLQVSGFLKVFKVCFENGISLDRDSFNQIFSLFFQKYGLNIPVPKLVEDSEKSLSEIKIQPLKISAFSEVINSQLNDIVREVSNTENDELIKSGLIFINMLFEIEGKDKYLEINTRRVLKSYFDQREALLNDLQRIEIISGKREIEIFSEFDSPERLEIQINKVLQDDENLRQNYKIDLNSYKTRIIDINNSLNRMITRFKERKRDYKLTLKTQNIMRNLNIHISVLKIFKLSYREQEHKDVFKSAIAVLYHFCKQNTNNQIELYPYVRNILALVQHRLKPAKLICQIFSSKKGTIECHKFIDTVFDLLSEQEPNYYVIHPQYLIMLRSLLLDEKRNAINENQRLIMSRLMKNKGFLEIIDFRIPEKMRASDIKDEDIMLLNYQVENMLLLGNLALDTRLGITQAKKTLSFDQIKSVLVGNSTPFIQKKAFLRCLFQIYVTKYADLNLDFEKKNMVDILNSIVLPDLKIFEKYIEGVIEIPYDNAEKQRKALDLRERIKKYRTRLSNYEGRDEKQGNQMSHMGKKILPPITNQSDQKKILRDSSEYWEYLNSGKSCNINQDGLLYFIIDCFYEIEVRNWLIDENLKEVLSNIRTSLTKMNELLLKIEEEINRDEPTMRLTKYTVLINECIDRLPDKKVVRLGKGLHIQSDGRAYYLMQDNTKEEEKMLEQQGKEGDEQAVDPVNIVLKKIKSFIMKRKMTLEEFMGLFRSVEDKIPVDEFRNKLKTFLGTIVKLSEIEEFITNIRKSKKDSNELDNTVSINKVYRKLQKSFERDRAVNFKEMMKKEEQGTMLEDLSSPNSLNIFRAMRNFIDYYVEFNLSNEEANNELRDLMTDMFLSSKKMSKKRIEDFSKSLGSLIKTFKKKRYELYLLRMLKYILKHLEKVVDKKKSPTDNNQNENDSDEDDENAQDFKEIGEFKNIQLIFAKSDALDLCLSNIREGVNRDLVYEAVELLNLILKGGNKAVQTHILDTLKESSLTSGYFNFIKLRLWDTVDNFKKLKETDDVTKLELLSPKNSQTNSISLESEIIIDFRITENLIKQIQLFCENCFNDFQNFLRSQLSPTRTTMVSSNLVNELSGFLIDLQLADPNIFQNTRMLPLVYASLQSLIDFCTGPCQENQKLLGNQRHLISFVNSFLNKDINFNSSNENDLQMIEIFSTIIKFLLALVNGNKDEQVKEFLLRQLHIDSLIRKLVIIYTTKIVNRDVNIFRQNRRCPRGIQGQHESGCAENHCVENFLTQKDVVITETAFNIYILLTIFTDEFPNDHKLEKFKYDKLNPEEKARLRELEQKYKNEKQKKGQFSLSSNILMQYNTQINSGQLRKGQVHPGIAGGEEAKPGKIFKPSGYKGLQLNDEENSAISPDNFIDGTSPLISPEKKPSAAPTPNQTSANSFRINFMKQLAENADKGVNFIDKDVQKQQEEETFKEFFALKERNIMYKARRFFKVFINSVEVSREDEISKNYFQVPFECDYMTENIRDHLIYRANRNSDVERLEHFFFNIPLYRAELEHRQRISKRSVFEWFVTHWKLFKDIAYISVVANNLIMLISYENDANGDTELGGAGPDASESLNLAFSIIQITLSVVVVVLAMIERLPISLYKRSSHTTESSKKKAALKKTLAIEKNRASLFTIMSKFFRNKAQQLVGGGGSGTGTMTTRQKIIRIIKDKDNLYNIIYLTVSIIAIATTPLVYSILLLDIVKRSDDLQNIIKSITHNITQLIKAVVLGLIVMYFYAIIGFTAYEMFFNSDGESPNIDCRTLLHCWTSVINYGVRSDGIGEIMDQVAMGETKYWSRWIFDLSFYVLVIIILLNIIFGIIIDTFGDLRDTRNEELKKVEQTCFICGLDKYDFDTRGNGWFEHIYKEHNIYAYLNFCIYIEKRDLTECNGIEKYVKEMIEKKDISFIPQGEALALQNE